MSQEEEILCLGVIFVGKLIWAVIEEVGFGVSSVIRWGIMLVSVLKICWGIIYTKIKYIYKW